jgi:cell division protein FtsL
VISLVALLLTLITFGYLMIFMTRRLLEMQKKVCEFEKIIGELTSLNGQLLNSHVEIMEALTFKKNGMTLQGEIEEIQGCLTREQTLIQAAQEYS